MTNNNTEEEYVNTTTAPAKPAAEPAANPPANAGGVRVQVPQPADHPDEHAANAPATTAPAKPAADHSLPNPPAAPCGSDPMDIPPLGKIVHEIDNLMFRHMIVCGKAYGFDQLTMMNGWILKYLSMNNDREVFQKDIESEFGITKSTVTGIIKLMEQKGFLTRVSVERDARLKKLVLTDMGWSYVAVSDGFMKEHNKKIQRNITAEELETFLTVIDKIKKNLKE